MTQKKSYSRYFIILQEDEKGYALASDKLPSGYAKLELKNDRCKVSYYVQNLKKESAPYYMVLICNKKDAKKLLKLGELNIDDHGRAEIFYEYPVDSVGNSGVNVDKVVGASIVRMMNSNIIPVMSGFTSNDIPDWKGFPMIEEEQKRQEEDRLDKKPQPTKVAPVQVQPVQPVQQTPMPTEETIEAHPEVTKEKPIVEETPSEEEMQPAEGTQPVPANIFDDYEMKIEQAKEQKPAGTENITSPMNMDVEADTEENRNKKKCKDNVCEIHHENECKENDHHENSKHKECKDNDHHENSKHDECKENDNHKHEDNKKHNPKGSVGAFFMDVADGFEELGDICTEIKRCKWYKVPVYRPEDMTNCMDYNKYTVVYYPMMNYYQYIRNFGHFIMGYKLDKDNKMKYLVYGIPGTKSRTHQPFGGKSGFVTWIPLKEGEEDEDSYGYWLMFYDFRNSTIVIPVK